MTPKNGWNHSIIECARHVNFIENAQVVIKQFEIV